MSLIKGLSSNPSSFKSRFSRRFLRDLMKIKTESSSSAAAAAADRVKIAADKSMALAVGTRRAWSRAIVWKIRHQRKGMMRQHRRVISLRRINSSVRHHKKRILLLREKKKKKKKKKRDDFDGEFCHANDLRKLVPGGEAMDLCSLLDETAHYLKCLLTQVQVMRSIDQFYSI